MTPRFVLPFVALLLAAAPVRAQQQQMQPPAESSDGYAEPKTGMSVVYDSTNTTTPASGSATELKQTTVMTIAGLAGDDVRYDFSVNGAAPNRARAFRGVLTVEVETEAGRIQTVGNHAALRALWPLAAGRTLSHDIEARFARRNPQTREIGQPQTIGMATQRWSVEARVTTETPAGRFETYLVRRQWELIQRAGNVAQTGDYKIWFAPALGWYVRFEGDEKTGDTSRRVVHVAREIKGR
jgi:hypothetical protein